MRMVGRRTGISGAWKRRAVVLLLGLAVLRHHPMHQGRPRATANEIQAVGGSMGARWGRLKGTVPAALRIGAVNQVLDKTSDLQLPVLHSPSSGCHSERRSTMALSNLPFAVRRQPAFSQAPSIRSVTILRAPCTTAIASDTDIRDCGSRASCIGAHGQPREWIMTAPTMALPIRWCDPIHPRVHVP